jgi:hypothetical protein
MPVDLAAWIKGLGLPEDKSKSVLELIGSGGDAANKYIEGNQLRQDEFSRKMDALTADVKKKEAELTTKLANEDKYHDSLASWDVKRKKELSDATAAREQAEQRLAAARDKVLALAKENDLPEDEIGKLFEGAPVSRTTPPNTTVDPKELDSRFVTREDFRTEAKAYAKLATLIPALERNHFKLFGDAAEPPDWEKLIEETTKLGGAKTLKQVYEETYKVAEKREEITTASWNAKIETAKKEAAEQERAKLLADNPALGQSVRSGEREGSPVLALATKQRQEADKNKPPANTGMSAVQSAVAAFNSGKYNKDKAA